MKAVPGFPFRSKFHAADGVRLAYVEQGKGEPVVLLHGNPTWGFLYRKFIAPLARTHRVIVPDHMGFGRSDKPLDPSLYRLARHIANLESLLLKLDVRNATLVMQDWGGPIGLGFAVRHPDRIKRLVIMNTWAWVIPAGTRIHPLLEQFRTPGLGEALVQGLNLFVEGFLPAGIWKKEGVTPALMRAYRAPFPDWNSRVGILAFPRDIVIGDEHPSALAMREIEQKLPTLKVPVLLIWAMKDPAFPKAMIGLWQKVYPHAQLHTLAEAGHYLQEDEPEQIVGLIRDFLRR